jgi:hypothetical protein
MNIAMQSVLMQDAAGKHMNSLSLRERARERGYNPGS